MLDLDFCLTNSPDVEDSFDDNPFCLDFSSEQEAELVSPPSSEDEHEETDDDMTEGGESSVVIHHQPAAVRSFSLSLAAAADFDLPAIVEDIDGFFPFELLEETPEVPSPFDQNIVDARKKLDECMRRTERTRSWINQYVRQQPHQEKTNDNISCQVVVSPSQPKKKDISKKDVPKSVRKTTSKKRRLNFKKPIAKQMMQYKKTKRTVGSQSLQMQSINYECSGVLPLNRQISDSSSTSSSSSKPTSISDFLRNSRKSVSIYN